MSEFHAHILPTFSPGSGSDALFHYTTARGLIGILTSGQLRNTAYYCANDESELATGQGVLTASFRTATHKLIESNDRRVKIFANRGVDIMHYADCFEQSITSMGNSSGRFC